MDRQLLVKKNRKFNKVVKDLQNKIESRKEQARVSRTKKRRKDRQKYSRTRQKVEQSSQRLVKQYRNWNRIVKDQQNKTETSIKQLNISRTKQKVEQNRQLLVEQKQKENKTKISRSNRKQKQKKTKIIRTKQKVEQSR